MIEDYDKKDMKMAPKVKKQFTLPDGWTMVEKRGRWCVRNPEGLLSKFATEKAAKEYIEEMN
tara:strand:- start:1490 stop:1675 length:186 start_codon:yes stop_codon:yes gene_type:complete